MDIGQIGLVMIQMDENGILIEEKNEVLKSITYAFTVEVLGCRLTLE